MRSSTLRRTRRRRRSLWGSMELVMRRGRRRSRVSSWIAHKVEWNDWMNESIRDNSTTEHVRMNAWKCSLQDEYLTGTIMLWKYQICWYHHMVQWDEKIYWSLTESNRVEWMNEYMHVWYDTEHVPIHVCKISSNNELLTGTRMFKKHQARWCHRSIQWDTKTHLVSLVSLSPVRRWFQHTEVAVTTGTTSNSANSL